MATDEQVQRVLEVYYEGLSCPECGASVRIGEYECAHCATDFEVLLREWAARVVDGICGGEGSRSGKRVKVTIIPT